MSVEDEMAQLRGLCPAAELLRTGAQPVVFLPGVVFQAGKARAKRDLLLCPFARDGYQSRLFLSQVVETPRPWTAFNIEGRTWHAVSWQGVSNTLPWIEILANHLRAFQ